MSELDIFGIQIIFVGPFSNISLITDFTWHKNESWDYYDICYKAKNMHAIKVYANNEYNIFWIILLEIRPLAALYPTPSHK